MPDEIRESLPKINRRPRSSELRSIAQSMREDRAAKLSVTRRLPKVRPPVGVHALGHADEETG